MGQADRRRLRRHRRQARPAAGQDPGTSWHQPRRGRSASQGLGKRRRPHPRRPVDGKVLSALRHFLRTRTTEFQSLPKEHHTMKKTALTLAIATGCLFGAVQASAMTKDEYKAEKDKISAQYKADKAQCDTLKDNAKDVCEKEAKGKENIAKAELEQAYKPSSSHAKKVAEAKADAAYDVAKEKCDDMSGDAKNACQSQAKADHEKAKADIKAMKG
eukprot:TRINITY_DN6754_c0_g1_i2.p2 TRINITY_DN6754_c0_g1~~TRINITY_DN6754_c0_g1_i2.p2  ORF type:complete len:216 (+),score=54.96 TRINITY_DN6754_c0_g1_i2:98-745(+)